MQLLIFRHGIAESQGPDGTDESRRLTDEGESRTRQAARGLALIAEAPQVILTSPLPRAHRTAAIAAEELGGRVTILDALAEHRPGAILDALRERDEDRIMIVGHEPTLSTLIQILCGAEAGMRHVQLKKAGCALLEVDLTGKTPVGTLRWLAVPRMLRLIGDGATQTAT